MSSDDGPVRALLEPLAADSVRVERVLAYHRDARDASHVKPHDFVAALERAEGDLAVVLEASTAEDHVGYHGEGRERFDAWVFDHVDEARGVDPVSVVTLLRNEVVDRLEQRKPTLKLREDTELASVEAGERASPNPAEELAAESDLPEDAYRYDGPIPDAEGLEMVPVEDGDTA